MDVESQYKSEKQVSFRYILNNHDIELLKQSQANFQTFLSSLEQRTATKILSIVRKWYPTKRLLTITTQEVKQLCESRVEKMIKNKRMKKNWSSQDVILLLWVVSKYMEYHKYRKFQHLDPDDWKYISACVPGTDPKMCQFRFLNLHKNKLSNYQWKEEQSQLLSNIVRGKTTLNWKQIAEEFYQINYDKRKVFRTAKQCREHWTCYLNPVLKKGPWKQEEDKILLTSIINNKGIKKWTSMSSKFEGRTQNALKNRFTLIVQKQMLRDPSVKDELSICKNYLKFNGIEVKIEEGTNESEQKANNMNGIQNEYYNEEYSQVQVKKEEDSVNQYENKIVPLILKNNIENYNNYWFQQNSQERQDSC